MLRRTLQIFCGTQSIHGRRGYGVAKRRKKALKAKVRERAKGRGRHVRVVAARALEEKFRGLKDTAGVHASASPTREYPAIPSDLPAPLAPAESAADSSMPNVLPRHFLDETPEETATRERFIRLGQMRRQFAVGSYDVEMVHAGFIQPHFLNVEPHEHAYFEVCYVHDGAGSFTMGEREYSVALHDLFIARPGERHSIRTATGRNLGLYFWSFAIVPRPRRSAASHDVDADAALDEMIDAFCSPSVVVASERGWIRRTLNMLDEELRDAQPGYTRAIDALLTKLIIDSVRTARGTISSEELDLDLAGTPAAVAKASVRFIRANYSRTIELEDVADEVCLSKRHLARLFRKEMGTSIVGYLTALRMDVARQLLLDPQLPIKQVARMVGYHHVHYFSTLFKRRVGMTPAHFRAQGGTKYVDDRVAQRVRALHESWKQR